jgi:excisionase family DNA binding protein
MGYPAIESEPRQAGRLAVLARHSGDYVLTLKESAEILSISDRTVQRLVASGKLTAVKISDRRIGILASELARFLSQNAGTAAAA